MLAISTNELELARTEYESGIMNDQFTLERKIKVDDGQGGQTDELVTLGPFPGRMVDLRVNRPLEFEQSEQITAVMTLEIIFPWDTDVHVDDVATQLRTNKRFQITSHNGERTDSLLLMANVIKLN